ncbi:MAG: HU family DNA-binding protein [Alphaproteobacteria bacterium]|nr:HU family DNA-binding protein [Alphaproteobacteria bacterium]
MNKKELVAKLAEKTGLTKVKAGEVIDAIFSAESRKGIIAIELDAGRKVTIPGFGTFKTRSRAARRGTNPSTGAAIEIPKKTVVSFSAGKNLRSRVET